MKTSTEPLDDVISTDAAIKTEQDILLEARHRFKQAHTYEQYNRELAEDDVDFRHGDQWPESIRREREEDDRPCLTFNKMEERIDQVTGDQRQGKAAITIHPVDLDADKKATNQTGQKDYALSQVMNGLIRSIEQNSDAQIAYNTGFDHAAGHGFGFWRIITTWDEFDPFSQVIKIRRIKNAFSVYMDPDCQEPHCGDMNWCFISSMMDRKLFENKYPNAKSAGWDFAGEGDEYDYWYEEDAVRVVEYFRKVPVKKLAVKMMNGAIHYLDNEDGIRGLEAKYQGVRVQAQKEIEVPKVEWYKLTAGEVLESPREFPGFYIPVVRCVGKELNVRGYDYYRGVIRHAKDAQRMYNYNRTAQVETTSLQPKVPFILTPQQVESFEHMWDRANKENFAFLLYNHVEGVPPPQRSLPPIPSQAHAMNAIADDADMDSTTGLHKASLGAPSNEKSGKAIRERKTEGDVATFAFHDNQHLALKQTGKILVDMIPRIYDTARVIRILTPEDEDDFIELNKTIVGADGKTQRVHDVAMGKYDIRVTAGPSYTSLREEARESMMDFAGRLPEVGMLIADLIAENQDWPKADAIAERIRKQLPPGIVDDNQEGEEEITPQMVQQAIQEAVQQVQQEIDNKVKLMDAETKQMAAQSKADTDEFKALTDRIETMQSMMIDEDKIKDIVAQGIAELLQQEQT